MNHIYITRHGQTDWNLVPKVQGMTDIPLNEQGIKQAEALANFVKEENYKFDMILYSPLSRAAVTAKIVSELNGIPTKEEPRLIEQNFGKWEGWANNKEDKSFYLAKQRFADSYDGGESMFHLAHRVYSLLDELKAKPGNDNYLLVTHGGIARCIHSYFFDMTNEEYSLFSMKNCEIKKYDF